MPCLRGSARPRPPHAALIVTGVLAAACGSGPSGPSGSPSPSPTTAPAGGVVSGRYLLQITPSAGCALSRATLSFPMDAAAAGTFPHPGVQVLLVGAPSALEAELMSPEGSVRGGIGTTGAGALSNETVRLWIHAIAAGSVTRAADGRGEVVSGTLMGYVALGRPDDDEGALGTCNARDHAFALRAR
jgi:hypothetical protein